MLNLEFWCFICIMVLIAVTLIDCALKNVQDPASVLSIMIAIILLAVPATELAMGNRDLFIEEVEISGRVDDVWIGDRGDIFIEVDGKVLCDSGGRDLQTMPDKGKAYTFQCLYYPSNNMLSRYEIRGVV